MLSHRHVFRAGSHSDVLKHIALVALLRFCNESGLRCWYVDAHAGAGVYKLESGYSNWTANFQDGIARVWDADNCPPLVADYLDIVRSFNPEFSLRCYPGSPCIAASVLASEDDLYLFETERKDFDQLSRNLRKREKHTLISNSDGLKGLRDIRPPYNRKLISLIDPSYESVSDYAHVLDNLSAVLFRSPHESHVISYPIIDRPLSNEMPGRLKRLNCKNWVNAVVLVKSPTSEEVFGSGVFIMNPPWTLAGDLRETLPWLAEALGQDEGAGHLLESS